MKLPVFHVPISVKAITAFLVAAAVNTLSSTLNVDLSEGWRVWISGGIGLAVAAVVPEGARYINAWLKRYGLPGEVDPTS